MAGVPFGGRSRFAGCAGVVPAFAVEFSRSESGWKPCPGRAAQPTNTTHATACPHCPQHSLTNRRVARLAMRHEGNPRCVIPHMTRKGYPPYGGNFARGLAGHRATRPTGWVRSWGPYRIHIGRVSGAYSVYTGGARSREPCPSGPVREPHPLDASPTGGALVVSGGGVYRPRERYRELHVPQRPCIPGRSRARGRFRLLPLWSTDVERTDTECCVTAHRIW